MEPKDYKDGYSAIHPHRLLLDGDSSMFLKLTSPEDSEQLYELVHANRQHLAKYQRWAKDINFETLHAAVADTAQKISADRWLQYRIMIPSPHGQHQMIGTITLYERDLLAGTANLGYWLAEAEQGKSYARKGAERVLSYAFEAWRLNRVMVHIHAGNEPGEGLAKRLGARPTEVQHIEETEDGQMTLRTWVLERS